MISLDNRYMEFRIGEQLYAIPLLSVKEVIQKPDVRLVPNMPPYFEGMMNLRGQILGVFSVRKKLAAKARDEKSEHPEVVVVIEEHGTMVGMIVDEVTRVLYADENAIKAAPLKEDDPAKKYIDSVIQADKELVLTIKVNQLFEMDKFKQLKGAA